MKVGIPKQAVPRVFKIASIGLLALGAVAISSVTAAGSLPAAASEHGSCEDITIPVALGPGLPKNHHIAATLCLPVSNPTNSVDLLVPGGTYNRTYWDFPIDQPHYSYVDRTLQSGRATLSIDRLGSGESSKPLSTLVTFDGDIYTVHQVVQWLKSSAGFSDVTSIGHSIGSIVAIAEAGRYAHDTYRVDRVVVTGIVHTASLNLLGALPFLTPAFLDSQFAGQGLDPGYVTISNGGRGRTFYSSSADPAVIAYDEAHKDIFSATEAAVLLSQVLVPPLLNDSSDIEVPVLTIVGDDDFLCGTTVVEVDCPTPGAVEAHEAPYYSNAATYDAAVVPDTGHNLTLHPSATQSFTIIDNWINDH